MKVIRIDKQSWAESVEKAKGAYRVTGPVGNGQFHEFRELGKDEAPDLGFTNTRTSAKSMVFPQSETMFEYSLDESREDHHIMKDAPKDYSPRAVVGIRPCDAYAFLLVKKNFDNPEYKDPYWINSYNASTFIGLACNEPCETCFCTTAGCGPFHEEGLDALLVDNGDHYLAKVITEKGGDFFNSAGSFDDAGSDGIEDAKKAAEEKIVSSVSTGNLKEMKTTGLYDAPFWEDVAFACINCGTCTYLCPTCWCFDIQDECHGDCGVRMKNWDSCMYPLFTLHGSGHNPRGVKVQRVRQRFMHKLKYYVEKYGGGIQCVGCGRCIRSCPVNIDIRKVCELMNGFEPEEGADAL